MNEPMIRKIPKTDHGGFYSTVSYYSQNRTVYGYIEDDEKSYYDAFQQDVDK